MSRDTNKSQNGDYDIGYGKTPPYTRFQKGTSGNPKGRPAKKRVPEDLALSASPSEIDAMVKAQLDRPVTVNQGGRPKTMKVCALVSQKQINAALKGNVYAQKEVLKAARDMETRAAKYAAALAEQKRAERAEEIETYNFIVKLKEQRAREWAAAALENKEPDNPWPHPDDILLYPDEQRWYPRGPFKKTEVPLFNWCKAERDYLFALCILESAKSKGASCAWADAYGLLWIYYDNLLPLRWQYSEKIEVAFFNLASLTTKKLAAEVERRHKHAELMKVFAGLPNDWTKESYKTVNAVMKPLLKAKGYRSLREFEHAFETHVEHMPWPKLN
jgi:Family of unknown function (DUF5681)